MRKNAGFTLIELLVVISIISLLSSIVFIGSATWRGRGRMAERRADLVQVRNALELYNEAHGGYPETLSLASNSNGWLYHYRCPWWASVEGRSDWIPGIVAEKYISELPDDPSVPNSSIYNIPGFTSGPIGGCRGYLYRSNGRDYKLLNIFHAIDATAPTIPVTDPYVSCPAGCSGTCSRPAYVNDRSYAVYSDGGKCW